MLLLAGLASAAVVAVVDFEAAGTPYANARLASEGVRDAFLKTGLLDPVPNRDLGARIAAADPDLVQEAGERFAEATRLRADGDLVGCAETAGLAADQHARVRADVARRDELADAWYLQGLCLTEQGASTEAWFAFAEVARLEPGYLSERAWDVTPAVIEGLASAQASADGQPPRPRTAEDVAAVGGLVGEDLVVTGLLDRKGRLEVQLWEAGELRAEGQVALRFPVNRGDPAFEVLVRELVEAAGIGREELPDAPVPVPVARPTTVSVEEPGGRGEQGDPDARPIARRWWIWAGAAAVVGGGATAAALLAGGPDPDVVTGPSTWSIRVSAD